MSAGACCGCLLSSAAVSVFIVLAQFSLVLPGLLHFRVFLLSLSLITSFFFIIFLFQASLSFPIYFFLASLSYPPHTLSTSLTNLPFPFYFRFLLNLLTFHTHHFFFTFIIPFLLSLLCFPLSFHSFHSPFPFLITFPPRSLIFPVLPFLIFTTLAPYPPLSTLQNFGKYIYVLFSHTFFFRLFPLLPVSNCVSVFRFPERCQVRRNTRGKFCCWQ